MCLLHARAWVDGPCVPSVKCTKRRCSNQILDETWYSSPKYFAELAKGTQDVNSLLTFMKLPHFK